jgi:hypothetical protein
MTGSLCCPWQVLLRTLISSAFALTPSQLCGYIALGLTIAAVKSGNGRHFANLTDEQRSGAILYTLAGFCPGILSFAIPKLAVVALLVQITNPSRKHRIFLWCMTIGCLLVLFGCVIIIFAQCNPSRSQWDFSVKGTCWSIWILIDYAIVVGSELSLIRFGRRCLTAPKQYLRWWISTWPYIPPSFSTDCA